MPTFKAEVYAHQKRADGTYNIKIRITHKRKKRYLNTSFYLTKDDLTRSLKIKNQYYIDTTENMIRKYRMICDKIGTKIESMDIDQIVTAIQNYKDNDHFELDIIDYGNQIIETLESTGHKGNASVYRITLHSLMEFTGRDKIDISEITVKFINDWIRWLTNKPALPNRTRGSRAQSLYPATLRSIHNKAKAEFNDEDSGKILIPQSPFKKVKLPQTPITRKRALSLEEIRQIIQLNYTTQLQPGNNRFNLAKDLFILSFGLIGMNAVDLYNCEHIKNGRITYKRIKTTNRRKDQALISIRIEPEIQELVDKYRDKTNKRVFNFYQSYSSVDTFSAAIGKGLKKIGSILDINDLEFYAARHSWATIAINDAGVDKLTVHESLNHVNDEMKVTDIYIKKSWNHIDNANRKVFDLLGITIYHTEEKSNINE